LLFLAFISAALSFYTIVLIIVNISAKSNSDGHMIFIEKLKIQSRKPSRGD